MRFTSEMRRHGTVLRVIKPLALDAYTLLLPVGNQLTVLESLRKIERLVRVRVDHAPGHPDAVWTEHEARYVDILRNCEIVKVAEPEPE